jgi:hypothetical protein
MKAETIKQAMIDGVMGAVREATAASFKVYKQSMTETAQQHRTSVGLVQISLAAMDMLNLIDELTGEPDA